MDAIKNGDESAATCWAPDGACRAGGHALIGGLAGGVGGAVAGGLSSTLAPEFVAFLRDNDVPEALARALTVGLATGMGAVLGGAEGAAAGLNEAANNAVAAAPLILEALAAAGEAAVLACVRSPKCVALIGAATLNAALPSKESEEADAGSNPDGESTPSAVNGADTYRTPPNGASPPPEGEPDDHSRSTNEDVRRVEVRNAGTPQEVSTYEANGQQVQINSGHGFTRTHATGGWEGTGLSQAEIEMAIVRDATAPNRGLPTAQSNSAVPIQTIEINGIKVGYRAVILPNGRIAIGTYFPY